jgi:hypothetical protein
VNIIQLLKDALNTGPVGIECNCGNGCSGTCTKAAIETAIKELENHMEINIGTPSEEYDYVVACERFGEYEEFVYPSEEDAMDDMDRLRESYPSVYMLMPRFKGDLL